jgi:hypothetical protein
LATLSLVLGSASHIAPSPSTKKGFESSTWGSVVAANLRECEFCSRQSFACWIASSSVIFGGGLPRPTPRATICLTVHLRSRYTHRALRFHEFDCGPRHKLGNESVYHPLHRSLCLRGRAFEYLRERQRASRRRTQERTEVKIDVRRRGSVEMENVRHKQDMRLVVRRWVRANSLT